MLRTTVSYHVHDAQPEGRFGGTSCWLHVDMDGESHVAAFFATPDDARATITSLTEALAQWEAYLAAKNGESNA